MNPSNMSVPDRFAGLDTLRSLAIISVMLYHFGLQDFLPKRLMSVAAMGWIGVDLFFVLSGFLIGSQMLKPGDPVHLADFYSRRAYRILPAFSVVLLLYLLVPVWREAPGPYAPLQYVTFTWNLLLLHYPKGRAFSHIWSLCVEEHFYLVLPLLVMAFQRASARWIAPCLLGGLLVGGICLRAWLLQHVIFAPDVEGDAQSVLMMKFIYLPTYSRLDGLVVGVALALTRSFKSSWWACLTNHGNLTFVSGVATVGAALWTCNFGFITLERTTSIVYAFPLLACGFGLLVLSAMAPQGIFRRSVPGTSTVAALAFSLYLTHKSVAHVVHVEFPVLTADGGWLPLFLYVFFSISAAAVLYLSVERPFLQLRKSRKGTASPIEREMTLDPAV